MKIYLVEDIENAPGRIYAVFAHEQDARKFQFLLEPESEIIERTLFYGQPPVQGYNE